MDHSLEYFEAQTTPQEETHEEVPTTSHEQEAQLDDMIERIGRLNLEENEAPPVDQPGPSRKILKWATKTIKIYHINEVGNTRTIISTRQEDGE